MGCKQAWQPPAHSKTQHSAAHSLTVLRFGTTALRRRHQISVPSPSHSLLSKERRFIRCRLATPASCWDARRDRIDSLQTKPQRPPFTGPGLVALVISPRTSTIVTRPHRPIIRTIQLQRNWTPSNILPIRQCKLAQVVGHGLPQAAAHVTVPFPNHGQDKQKGQCIPSTVLIVSPP